MKSKFTFLLILGFAYFYTVSNIPIPFLFKNYLAIVPFQVSALIYGLYLFSPKHPRKTADSAQNMGS